MPLFLPDANVLIHALVASSSEHEPCRRWLLEAAAQGDEIGICELVEVALLRISTLPRLRLAPMGVVLGYWREDLWGYAGARRLVAGANHAAIFAGLVTRRSLRGNDVNDAWLAALALEHRATLVSTDAGFARFPGLAWIDPAA